jgi:hypothetical protein
MACHIEANLARVARGRFAVHQAKHAAPEPRRGAKRSPGRLRSCLRVRTRRLRSRSTVDVFTLQKAVAGAAVPRSSRRSRGAPRFTRGARGVRAAGGRSERQLSADSQNGAARSIAVARRGEER